MSESQYQIMDLVRDYRSNRDSLKRYKQQHYKEGTKVHVNNNRHSGYGTCPLLTPHAPTGWRC